MAAVSKAVGCICIAALCLSLLLRVSADEAASDDGAHFHRLHLKPGILGVPPRDLLTWHGLKSAVAEAWDIFGPGGRLHPAYFLAHKGHLVVEGLLLVVIGYLFLQQAFKPHPRSEEPLTEKEVDQLCREWKPEPLTPTVDEKDRLHTRLITSYDGKYLVADGKRALDAATHNFLGLSGTKEQKAVARDTVEKYGVGSCGPRGFYGTIDVHLKLEDQLAAFLGTPQAIIYSSDTATITSIIPAFANRKDVLVIDEGCSYATKQGASISRAAVHYFKHNDMSDLERILKRIQEQDAKERKPLNRRLIVVEGIYGNTGELAPLRELVTLKEKYKYRLVVDESYSFGVLGASGRGAIEHWGLKQDDIEVMCASMGTALGSVGGFCVGTEEIVEHQRLSGSGYCFSASLPPYLATAASEALTHIQLHGHELARQVRDRAVALRTAVQRIQGLHLMGAASDPSPVLHVRLSKPPKERHDAHKLLQDIADHALHEGGVLVGVAAYSCLDRNPPPPSLIVTVSSRMDDKDLDTIATALRKAAAAVL